MQRSKFLQELRDMDDDGLNDKLSELQSEFIRLRFQLTIRQLENHRRIPEVRKQIARIKTIQHQRNQEEVVGG